MAHHPEEAARSDEQLVRVADIVRELLRAPLRYGLLVLMVAALGTIFAFVVTPRYRAEVTVIPSLPNDAEGALGGLSSQLGGLAALAGLDMPGQVNKYEAIEYLESKDLAAKVIEEKQLLPTLFSKKWDAKNKRWNDPDDPPTLGDGIRVFTKRIRGVSEDRRTGVVTVSITWPDRVQATQWANDLVARANQELRERTIAEAKRSIDYLQHEVDTTVQVPVREGLYRLMENQLKTVMMANARHDYAFKVIDPARQPEPEDFVFPQRLLTIVGSLIAGCILAGVVALIRAARPG
jgi:uncharacterized protein involved in exopolysaccharide biosynthesis